MNLIFGKRTAAPINQKLQKEIRNRINEILEQEPLHLETVLSACEKTADRLDCPEVLLLLQEQGLDEQEMASAIAAVKTVLDRHELQQRYQRELNGEVKWEPLGTLFHISAGNAYGLPAFSVLEGLLTGNINLLKLPGQGDEISLLLLEALIQAEPRLADYIWVFSFSSEDQKQLKLLAAMADAVAVWGGDEAIQAVRMEAEPNLRLIEWGHKISFAYVQPEGISTGQLQEIAAHMSTTRQLYCNSCQGIYLDTDDFEAVREFAERFSHYLSDAYQAALPKPLSDAIRAQLTLQLRRREIEAMQDPSGQRLYRCGETSVQAVRDAKLEPSLQFGNCWIKPLPQAKLIRTLKSAKSYLQTAALYCQEQQRKEYARLLFRAGICRVTTAAKLNQPEQGFPHDGEYALRKYCRIVIQD